MKRWLPVFLVLLLFSGCAGLPNRETSATDPTMIATQIPADPSPAGCYDPDSELERLTGGAVRVYTPNLPDTYHISLMGQDILLFSGLYTTKITKLSGSLLCKTAEVELPCCITLFGPSVQINETGISFYDDLRRELVRLNSELQEVSRIPLPDEMSGYPALSDDRRFVYYCTDRELRCLDLDTGLNRLVREMNFSHQELLGIHCAGTVLECTVADENSNWFTMFLSAQTGQLLESMTDQVFLYTNETSYFATHFAGNYRELLTGKIGQAPSMLHYDDMSSGVEPLMNRNAVLLLTQPGNPDPTVLDYYDLHTGTRRYQLRLPSGQFAWCYVSDAESNVIWFMRYDPQSNFDTICRWDLTKSRIEDDSVYLGERRTDSNPDLDGIARCRRRAEKMSAQFGVEILLWDEAVRCQPWDYTLAPEHYYPMIQDSLDLLEAALRKYPDGFLKKAASDTGNGVLRIGLVRSITGKAEGNVVTEAAGLQYWDDNGSPYIALAIGSRSDQYIHHELFHFLENRILSSNSYLDNWEDLNPAGFAYDYDYVANLRRMDYSLTEGTARAFIDMYSMSYPREDRARIMEYAITDDHSEYFATSVMQAKLRRICLGIRDAFGLKKSPETYPWEQYLEVPLAYNP